MTCSLLDLGCHFGSATAPVFAFINAWAWLGWFIAGLIIGGILGWRVVLAVLTLGVGYFLYDRFKKGDEPEYETGEPTPPVKKRRKTIF
jgi:hypothetical protein